MSEQHLPTDQQIDRNLRQMAVHVPLPAAKAAGERVSRAVLAAAGSPARQAAVVTVEGVKGSSRKLWSHRLMSTLNHTGGKLSLIAAVAAGVAAVLLISPGASNEALAAAIFKSLGDQQHPAVTVELRNLEFKDSLINVRVGMLFDEPVSLKSLIEHFEEHERLPAALVFQITMDAGDTPSTNPHDAGIEVAGALTRDQSLADWVFVRTSVWPNWVLDDTPEAALSTLLLSRGMLIDLSDVPELRDLWADDAADVTDVKVGLDASIPADATRQTLEFNVDLTADKPTQSAPPNKKVALSFSGADADEDFARRLLLGELNGADFSELAEKLEASARDVKLVSRGQGAWLLSAKEFDLGQLDELEQELVGRAELQIAYREGSGIESVSVLNLGQHGGSLLVKFGDAVENSLLTPQAYLDLGYTPLSAGDFIKNLAPLQPTPGKILLDSAEGQP